ncbi:MAG: aminoacyl-tRNA hydrolase [Lentisphaerae bacterium]|nr:aminoacyl-tRNA hydrolase [Lentisphaerota bacterium]
MKIVVGLGNPGQQYAHTPHNAGFDVVDALSRELHGELRRSLRFKAHTGKVLVGEAPVLLVKPDTFMNLSGEAVAAILRRTGAEMSEVVVVLDDADLPLGRLRIRPGGSSGGHRGLASIVACTGTDAFARVRIGVGRGAGARDLVEHVLSRPPREERELLEKSIVLATQAVLVCLREGVEPAMNQFNGMVAKLDAAG